MQSNTQYLFSKPTLQILPNGFKAYSKKKDMHIVLETLRGGI